jgi:hypothetical protein
MRNLVLSGLALAALALCACGSSSKEVAMAKTARYQGDKLQLFAETKAVVETKYKIAKSDEVALGMSTQARWFTPEGLAANDSGDVSMLQDKSLNITLIVELLPDGDKWLVKVTPKILRYNRGIPKPEDVKEDDISLPNWVGSRTDELALDIHKRLSKFEVKTVPQQVPAGNESPPPAPAAGSDSAAAPATGSASATATP